MTDLLCLDDVDELAREVDARTAYIQDMYHRLIEERGSNLDDPNRGLGVVGWLSDTFDPQWPAMIVAECRKDERTEDATASVQITDGNNVLISLVLTYDEEQIALALEVDRVAGVKLTEVDQ